jgi:hypothetical protein
MGGKLVSVAAWCVAVWTTMEFLKPLVGVADGQEATAVLLSSALIQAIFTWGESPIWNGRPRWWHFAVLALDTITNIGGLYFFVMKIDQTDSWRAFNEGLSTTGDLNPFAALVVSAVLGILLAATPEFLWRQG